jgi:hypothetical protein
MKTTPEALKDLYVALGGDASAVADASTSVDVLNAIAEKLGGEGGAVLNPDAIDNITAVAGNAGGGVQWLAEYKGTGADLNFTKEEMQAVIDAVRESDTSVPVLYCTAKMGQQEITGYAGGFKVETSASGATLTFAIAVLVVQVVLDSTEATTSVTVKSGGTDISAMVTFTEMNLGAVKAA